MSREAQAERERQARIILGTAETEIASKFVEAADSYREHPTAMQLRAMNMLYESIVKRGSLMVVPSGLADSLNLPAVMGMMGAAGLVPRDGAVPTVDITAAQGIFRNQAPAASEDGQPRDSAITEGATHPVRD
jgi:hypothetical protein